MGFFESVGNFFSDAYHKAESAVTTIYNDIKGGVSSVFHSVDDTAKSLLNTIQVDSKLALTDAHDLIDKGGHVIESLGNNVASTTQSLGNNVQKTVVGVADDVPKVASSMSLPLMMAAGAGVLFLALKK